MKLNEIAVGTEIDIEVKIGQKDMSFRTVAEGSVKGVLLAEPFIYEGKVIDLSGEGVAICVSVKDEEEIPLQFKGCVGKNVHSGEKTSLALACPNEGKRVNRRSAFRVFIGENGSVEPAGGGRLDVVVRDLSLAGFSFVTNVSEWQDDNSVVWLTFVGRYNEKMRMQGAVVRCAEGENGRLIVGCRIIKCANDLTAYIAYKQRENLKRFADKRE